MVDGVESRSTWLRGVVERRQDTGAERCAAAREQEEKRLSPIQSAGGISCEPDDGRRVCEWMEHFGEGGGGEDARRR